MKKFLGEENVVIDIQQISKDEFFNVTYYAANAAAEDWDLSGAVGWNPDMKIHQLILISLNQLIVSKRKLIWAMMTHQMQLQQKLV